MKAELEATIAAQAAEIERLKLRVAQAETADNALGRRFPRTD
jgi:uncharacterized small protein (DUF1192 family)